MGLDAICWPDFVKSGIFDHVIYTCTACYDNDTKINSMFKCMNLAETGTTLVNLISIDGAL